MPMQLFTNCATCGFYKAERCSLGKWETPGFKDLVVKTDDMVQVVGRICPYHRVPAWFSEDCEERLAKECSPKYALIMKSGDGKKTVENIERALSWKFPPSNIYIIDYGDVGSELPAVRKCLKDFSEKSRIKIVLDKDNAPECYVDQYIMTKKIEESYYIYCEDLDKYNVEVLLDKVNFLLFEEMRQVLWAGQPGCYFTYRDIHETVKFDHDLYLKEINLGQHVYEMELKKC
jgi:hypothetical protein